MKVYVYDDEYKNKNESSESWKMKEQKLYYTCKLSDTRSIVAR